ncbi:hypothetical protein DPMN_182715 [Dreissena polymorpha]|uniref:Uncharacterized protein n=1 Tax=Dreissena polymorpha TaxID=45954 RepID=A0A9D4DEQ9_DREPO|nr:hypothetical protein DPMN_182715 [Dreissena polymorpha]
MLYGLVDLAEKKKDGLDSSTSSECWWIKPSRKRKLSSRRSQDLTFKKHKFNDTKPQPVKENIKVKSGQTVKPVNILNFSEILMSVNKHSAWLYTYKFSLPKSTQETIIEIPKLHNVDFMFKDSEDLSDQSCVSKFTSYFSTLSVSEAECETIKSETKGQSNNSSWHMARKGRLTTSNFGVVCKRKPGMPPENLVKVLMNYTDQFDGPSVCWGRSHEHAALRIYEDNLKKMS